MQNGIYIIYRAGSIFGAISQQFLSLFAAKNTLFEQAVGYGK